jgi:hypothetical protein
VAVGLESVDLFCIEVARRPAGELTAAWKAWGEVAADPLPARSKATQ